MEYVAAAERRKASHHSRYSGQHATRKIAKAAIIGAGTMGGGIAMSLANIRHSGCLTRCFAGGA